MKPTLLLGSRSPRCALAASRLPGRCAPASLDLGQGAPREEAARGARTGVVSANFAPAQQLQSSRFADTVSIDGAQRHLAPSIGLQPAAAETRPLGDWCRQIVTRLRLCARRRRGPVSSAGRTRVDQVIERGGRGGAAGSPALPSSTWRSTTTPAAPRGDTPGSKRAPAAGRKRPMQRPPRRIVPLRRWAADTGHLIRTSGPC
jgi:hypothetical protein